MDKNEMYNIAKERVSQLKGFYSHLTSYVLINIMLAAINLLTEPGRLWFFWITIFWGFGLLSHGATVFIQKGIMGQEWEKRKIEEIVRKLSDDEGGKKI